ncbi:unnamed protein product [Ambrosiozyma monospora]|uniref:Unnamed protein product n=1 Tax=Ambrosiozyma monospora TaxID=43982 RepID=A0ACB5TAS4_AMBMO|nr:unnamed protein product [Ambrosiozyma monospora]
MSTAIQKRKLSTGLAVTQKVFVRSRNGGALKIVREHYLRDDIPCSSQSCDKCTDFYFLDASTGELTKPVLSDTPLDLKGKADIGKHYVILDTNVVLNAIDMLESDAVFYDVIVPQTVLEEVKNKSFAIYLRLRTLCKNEEKRVVVFHNEFKSESYLAREKGEIINDYNDRLIRNCAKFYTSHLNDTGISVVLLTNDKANIEKAKADDVKMDSQPS